MKVNALDIIHNFSGNDYIKTAVYGMSKLNIYDDNYVLIYNDYCFKLFLFI